MKKTENSILLADDSQTFLMYVGILVKRLGYQTYLAKDGVEAIKLAKEKKPSIIVLDCIMPRLDGASCLSIIRKDPDLMNTPVLVVTSYGDEKAKEEFSKLGACGFLKKPVNVSDFHNAIKHCMKEKNHRQNIRVSLIMRALVECQDEKRELYASNLSVDGIFLRTIAPFEAGTELDIVFSVDQEDPVELKGKVVYINKLSPEMETEPGMGIKFIEVPEDIKERINCFLMNNLLGDLTVEGGEIEASQFN